jgi:hypothetical protein
VRARFLEELSSKSVVHISAPHPFENEPEYKYGICNIKQIWIFKMDPTRAF